jgi:hypothetical protein
MRCGSVKRSCSATCARSARRPRRANPPRRHTQRLRRTSAARPGNRPQHRCDLWQLVVRCERSAADFRARRRTQRPRPTRHTVPLPATDVHRYPKPAMAVPANHSRKRVAYGRAALVEAKNLRGSRRSRSRCANCPGGLSGFMMGGLWRNPEAGAAKVAARVVAHAAHRRQSGTRFTGPSPT